MDSFISMPRILSHRGNTRQETIGAEGGFPNGLNTFLARSIVVLTVGTAVITSNNTAPSDGDQVSIGGQVYTFKTTLGGVLGQVLINTTADAALLNLSRAINGTGTPGTDYVTGTPVNTNVTASSAVTSHTITVTGRSPYITRVALSAPVGSTITFSSANLANAGLRAVKTGEVLACGLVPDVSNTDLNDHSVNPPYDLHGQNHWPFDLHGLQFLINIAALSSGAAVIGQANGGKQLSSVVVGSTYGIATATTGTYAGYQFLDPTNTSNLLMTVVEIPPLQQVIGDGVNPGNTQQTPATYNGFVVAEINSSLLQSLN